MICGLRRSAAAAPLLHSILHARSTTASRTCTVAIRCLIRRHLRPSIVSQHRRLQHQPTTTLTLPHLTMSTTPSTTVSLPPSSPAIISTLFALSALLTSTLQGCLFHQIYQLKFLPNAPYYLAAISITTAALYMAYTQLQSHSYSTVVQALSGGSSSSNKRSSTAVQTSASSQTHASWETLAWALVVSNTVFFLSFHILHQQVVGSLVSGNINYVLTSVLSSGLTYLASSTIGAL